MNELEDALQLGKPHRFRQGRWALIGAAVMGIIEVITQSVGLAVGVGALLYIVLSWVKGDKNTKIINSFLRIEPKVAIMVRIVQDQGYEI